jgi:hypothetical protein
MNTVSGIASLVGASATAETNSYPVAIWLVPAQNQQPQLQEIITYLSKKYSTEDLRIPTFLPHATLCGGNLNKSLLATELPRLLGNVDNFCATQKEVWLESKTARPIDHRDRQEYADTNNKGWATFLYAALEPNDEALRLFSRAGAHFPSFKVKKDPDDAHQRLLLPHISLMYCYPTKFSEIERRGIETMMSTKVLGQFLFDAIQVVSPHSGRWEDILSTNPSTNRSWDVVYTKKLGIATSPTTSLI